MHKRFLHGIRRSFLEACGGSHSCFPALALFKLFAAKEGDLLPCSGENQEFVAASDLTQQAAPSFNLAASAFISSSMAARSEALTRSLSSSCPAIPGSSPSHQHRLHLATLSSTAPYPQSSIFSANPIPYSSHAAIPPLPAIPVLLDSPRAASPPSRWRDEVPITSPATMTTTHPLTRTSRLRALASPWKPGKPTLPSLLVGDIPLLVFDPGGNYNLTPPLSHPHHQHHHYEATQDVKPRTSSMPFTPLRGRKGYQARKMHVKLRSRLKMKMKKRIVQMRQSYLTKDVLDPG